jgi:hypothetical protein
MYPQTRWTLIGVEVAELESQTAVLHLGTTNFNDEPFGMGRRGISICGKRIGTNFHIEDKELTRCLQCRMVINDFMGDPDGNFSGGTGTSTEKKGQDE